MKKLLFFILTIGLTVPFIVGASLWQYYQERGQNLPTVQERSPIANLCDIENYAGTAEQNIKLERCLRNKSNVTFFDKLRDANAEMGMLGSFNFVQLQDMYLSGSGITSSVSSVTLTEMDYPNDNNVVMADFGEIGYGTLEPNTAREENLSFTGITQNANGSATLTGVSRGLGLSYPYTASSTLAFAHAGGTIFRITNSAPFYNELIAKQNTAIFQDDITFSTTTGPITRTYWGDNQGAYLWYNSTTDQFGWASSTSEFQFNTEGTIFTAVNPLTMISGELKIATSSYWFSLRDNLFAVATGTGTGFDEGWNRMLNATSTADNLQLASTTLTGNTLVAGNSTSTGNINFSGEPMISNRRMSSFFDPWGGTTRSDTDKYGLATSSLLANDMDADSVLRIDAFGSLQGASGANAYFSIELGSIEIASTTNTTASASSGKNWRVSCLVKSTATNAQRSSCTWFYSNLEDTFTRAATTTNMISGVDMTSAQNLKFYATLGNADNNVFLDGGIVELIK